jgi:hypothetical protein
MAMGTRKQREKQEGIWIAHTELDTGAVVAVTLQGAEQGDTTTLDQTLCEAGMAVAEQMGREAELGPGDKPKVNVSGIEELVTDKGYHSGAAVKR